MLTYSCTIVHVCVRRMSVLTQSFKRCLATSVSSLSRKTVVYSNGVVASWHPAEPVPYEKTKPIPVTDSVETSVLSSNLSSLPRDLRNGPSNADLKEIFYTDKNEWYSRTREDRLRSVAGPRSKRH